MSYIEGYPEIGDYETDVISRADLAQFFQVTEKTVDKWRFGRDQPKLPFFRIGPRIYLSRAQVTHWLNEVQRKRDPYFDEREREVRRGR